MQAARPAHRQAITGAATRCQVIDVDSHCVAETHLDVHHAQAEHQPGPAVHVKAAHEEGRTIYSCIRVVQESPIWELEGGKDPCLGGGGHSVSVSRRIHPDPCAREVHVAGMGRDDQPPAPHRREGECS